jgi:hypothetical protein
LARERGRHRGGAQRLRGIKLGRQAGRHRHKLQFSRLFHAESLQAGMSDGLSDSQHAVRPEDDGHRIAERIRDTLRRRRCRALRVRTGADETAMRLWHSDFLPEETKKRGLVAFMKDMLEPTFPPEEMKKVAVLELNGTKDEVLPPSTVDANRKVMEPYARKYRVGRIEGLHHYLFRQESIKTVGSTWMRYIESGYFD